MPPAGDVCEPLFGFHPQSNGQTERANQDWATQELEKYLHCFISNGAGQSMHITHYLSHPPAYPRSSGGMFPEQEIDAGVPSVEAFILRCCLTWSRACASLIRVSAQKQRQVNLPTAAPKAPQAAPSGVPILPYLPFQSYEDKSLSPSLCLPLCPLSG